MGPRTTSAREGSPQEALEWNERSVGHRCLEMLTCPSQLQLLPGLKSTDNDASSVFAGLHPNPSPHLPTDHHHVLSS